MVEATSSKYLKEVKKIYLDGDQTAMLVLKPNDDIFKIYMYTDNTATDIDLNLKMKTASGEECVVNHLNRRCPYAEYKSDVELGQKGYEMIAVS